MVRRHLLAALARGVESGDEDAARAALARVDWVLRGLARRRLERTLIDAQLEAGPYGASGDPAAMPHVMRIAALRLRRRRARPTTDVTDVGAVADAFAALPPPPPISHAPIATVFAAVIATALVTTVIVRAIVTAPPNRSFVRALPPPSAGAFRDGGTPLEDAAIEGVLKDTLPALIIATDRAVNKTDTSDPERLRLHVEAANAPAMQRHAGLAETWPALVESLDRWAHLTPADHAWDRAVADLRGRARAVSDQLAGLGLGYYVEGDAVLGGGLRHGVVFTYRIEHVAFVARGTRVRRVLGLRRLDRLNLSRSLLGMHSSELGDPLLLLDQIDEHVATHLLHLLSEDGSYPLGDGRYRARRGDLLGAVAGNAVRAELFEALGPDAPTAQRIGELAADRAEKLRAWQEYLHLKDLSLRRVDTALLPPNYLPSLAPVLPEEQRARMAQLDAEMAELGVPRIAARLHDLVAATVRRHEAQHAFDGDRATPLLHPTSLMMMVGPILDADGVEQRLAIAARTELSAYVAQIASDPVTPHLALWALARSAFDRTRWGRPESYVAAVVIDGLARELGVPSVGVVWHDGKLDRERLRSLALGIAERRSDEVRAAAARLWTELFGERFVPLVDSAAK